MQPTHNTLPEAIRAQSIESLSRHLAAVIDLQSHLRQARWNVRGSGSTALRELLEQAVKQTESFSDIMAERIGALGGTAYATVRLVAARSFLPDYNVGVADEQAHVFAVAKSLAAFGHSATEAIRHAASIDDPVTAGLFTGVGLSTDSQLFLVESHLSGTSLFNGIEHKKGFVAEDTAA